MSLVNIRSWWEARTRWEKIAIALWTIVFLVVSVRVYLRPTAKTVYPIYSACGQLWASGSDLYAPDRPPWAQGGYRYSPMFAILCVPFSLMPDDVGGVVWRLVCTGAMLASLAWLARVASAKPFSRDQVAWLMLLCIPLSVQSVNNGQANIIIAACLLASVAAVIEQRWNLVAICVAVAFACKVYPLALGLLLMVLYPRQLWWRIALGVTATVVLPFVLQRPDYVLDQYEKWVFVLRTDDRSAIDLDQSYRDLWLLIRLYSVPVSRDFYVLFQMIAGAGLAILCWHRQHTGWEERPLLISTLALAATWMMLLGPTTESSSFILMAPSLSWSVVELMRSGASPIRKALIGSSMGLFFVAIAMADFKSIINIHAVGVHSWACVCYFLYLLSEPRDFASAKPQATGMPHRRPIPTGLSIESPHSVRLP